MASAKRLNGAVSVGASANAQILAANSLRAGAVILNNSAGIVYLGRDNTVSAANGVPLAAGASISEPAGEVSTSEDAWWVFNGQAGAADVRWMEWSQP